MIESATRRKPPEEGESYFISMTDMMVGLLLVFIILLAYFALNLQTKTAELTDGNETRKEILEALEDALKKRGVPVYIDPDNGILRLPDDILFAKGEWILSLQGQASVSRVANAMVDILPCYTVGLPCPKERSPHSIDAIFVEGHTDSDRMLGGMDNYDLSVRRAANTFRKLRNAEPGLVLLRNRPLGETGSAPILSLSGYGPDRPIQNGTNEQSKKQNRRIDLRFLMVAPEAGTGAGIRDILVQQ